MIRPSWSNDQLFEFTRTIVIAEWQNIVFDQFLTALLGSANPFSQANPPPYDPTVDASITNSFATAAYRFGHSMVQGLHSLFTVPGNFHADDVDLSTNFFESSSYVAVNGGGAEWLLNGLMRQSARKLDPAVTEALTNHLFANNNAGLGSDLIARNINRGRDHGLPSYNDFREACGLPKICSWGARPAEISPENWETLRHTYALPMDIDLFPGGLAEEPVNGGILGETFSCLVSEQFRKLIQGDRFFFTHQAPSHPLIFAQIQKYAIFARTLGDLICDNTDITEVRKNVFRSDSPFVSCEESTKLDINVFFE